MDSCGEAGGEVDVREAEANEDQALHFKSVLKTAGRERKVRKVKVKEEDLSPYQASYDVSGNHRTYALQRTDSYPDSDDSAEGVLREVDVNALIPFLFGRRTGTIKIQGLIGE